MHRLSGNVRVQGPLKLSYFREPSFFDLFLVFLFQQGERTYLFVFFCCIFWGLGDVRTLLGTTKIKMTENHEISLFLTLCKKNREKEQQSLRKLLKPFMSPNLYFLHTIWKICFCSKCPRFIPAQYMHNMHILCRDFTVSFAKTGVNWVRSLQPSPPATSNRCGHPI